MVSKNGDTSGKGNFVRQRPEEMGGNEEQVSKGAYNWEESINLFGNIGKWGSIYLHLYLT